jgi:hypothetical protein
MALADYQVLRIANDAAEKAVEKSQSDAARAERLRTRLGPLVGVIPDEHVTSREVGKYGLEKLGQEAPDSGDHATALEYFLAGRAGAKGASPAGGMDSLDDNSVVGRYIRGEV